MYLSSMNDVSSVNDDIIIVICQPLLRGSRGFEFVFLNNNNIIIVMYQLVLHGSK